MSVVTKSKGGKILDQRIKKIIDTGLEKIKKKLYDEYEQTLFSVDREEEVLYDCEECLSDIFVEIQDLEF